MVSTGEIMRFELKGIFRKEGVDRKFSKEIEAESESLAKEKLFSLIGSEHNVKRRFIQISEIKEFKE